MAARGTGRSQAGGSLDGVQQGLLENMKYCARCGNGFGFEFDRCPTDGEVLQEPTITLDTELSEVPEGTGDLALEIEDIIFRICSSCHDSFGGLLDVCPKDGCRLSEPSMITRHALLRDGGEGFEPGTRLRKYCTSCNKQFALHWKTCPECGSALTVPTLRGPWESGMSSAREGQVIADKYRVIHDIGAGGFGSVYLAKHESLGKCYAIKMLRAQLSNRPSFRGRSTGTLVGRIASLVVYQHPLRRPWTGDSRYPSGGPRNPSAGGVVEPIAVEVLDPGEHAVRVGS